MEHTYPEKQTIKNALVAYRQGDHEQVRQFAIRSALENPHQETAWLLLAAISKPRESIGFLLKALQVNPASQSARKGIRWAVKRLRSDPEQIITAQPLFEDRSQSIQPAASKFNNIWKGSLFVLGRILNGILILLGIILLTWLGLYLSRQGKLGLPVDLPSTILAVGHQVFEYITNHPATYIWHKEQIPVFQLTSSLFLKSTGLLIVALAMGVLAGMLLGILAALGRKAFFSRLVLLISLPGISMPSFLLAMLFWIVNIRLSNAAGLNKAIFPATGFGWDLHLIMPALVLAARPLAQIMQVTYVNLSEVLNKEFIQVARARGASWSLVLFRHALPNILIPVLTTLGTSLRFSLASLPIVESFFIWPGIGSAILQAISLDLPELIVDLIATLGILFLVVNLTLDVIYQIIDPRLRETGYAHLENEESGWNEFRESTSDSITGFLRKFFPFLRRRPNSQSANRSTEDKETKQISSLPKENTQPLMIISSINDSTDTLSSDRRFILRKAITNPLLIFGSLAVILLLGLAIFGDKLIRISPYQTHNIITIAGKVASPPFSPSEEFPWGSDLVGRDIRALVLAGAKQTLSLAFFATLARVSVGVLLGLIAGWWQNRWPDRLIHSFISILAAFPMTLFAMIMILALGIQKGMSVFIIAFCLTGWGEITQYIRGVVISQKPMQYIEAACSLGARARDILHRHILPHLVPAVLVLAILEMGSILMLLAELGFLNIFLGGGFSATIGEAANMTPVKYFFSDVPEWGSLLANIRNWWRSYPWLAWYPGLFFFFSILAFNIWGEGMRRFIEESRINISRLINRYTVVAGFILLVITIWAFRTATPIQIYTSQARQFDTQNVMEDIKILTSPEFEGRESAQPVNKEVADYLSRRMQEIGLFPAGQHHTFIREQKVIYNHLTSVPTFGMVDENGNPTRLFIYDQDFREYVGQGVSIGNIEGAIIGVAVGGNSGQLSNEPLSLRKWDLSENIILIHEEDLGLIKIPSAGGVLVISKDTGFLSHRILYPFGSSFRTNGYPILEITPQVADILLKTSGSSLDQFDRMRESLPPDEYETTKVGSHVHMILEGTGNEKTDAIYDVIGFIPGTAGSINPVTGQQLDSQVILVSAYYDGSGTDPNGTLYPSANDNASGVAMLLEIARVMIEGDYKPEKTMVFAAWAEGERNKSFSVTNTMGSKVGFEDLTVEAVIELSGVGAGSGKSIALDQSSSYRLVSLFEEASKKIGVTITTRGRGPHFGGVTRPDFAGRTALSAYVSWDGADELAHTPLDIFQNIDPEKIRKTGETTSLVISVLSRETEY